VAGSASVGVKAYAEVMQMTSVPLEIVITAGVLALAQPASVQNAMRPSSIRVAIIDDHPMFSEGVVDQP
jgi:hypothetical protein